MRPAPLPGPWYAEETALGVITFLPQIRCGDGKIFSGRALPTRTPTLAPAILPYISHPCFSIQAQSAPPLLQSWLLSPVLLRRNQMPTREKRSGASKRKVPPPPSPAPPPQPVPAGAPPQPFPSVPAGAPPPFTSGPAGQLPPAPLAAGWQAVPGGSGAIHSPKPNQCSNPWYAPSNV